MKVLTVYAHPDPCRSAAVLEQFTAGLHEAGHGVQVVDLYAIKFDPEFRTRDMASYLHEDMPPDILDAMNLKQRVLDTSPADGSGGVRVALAARQEHAGVADSSASTRPRTPASSGRRSPPPTGWRSSRRCSGCTSPPSSRAG